MSSEEALRGHLVRAKTALIHAATTARIVRSELNNPRADAIADAVNLAAGAVGDAVAVLTAARAAVLAERRGALSTAREALARAVAHLAALEEKVRVSGDFRPAVHAAFRPGDSAEKLAALSAARDSLSESSTEPAAGDDGVLETELRAARGSVISRVLGAVDRAAGAVDVPAPSDADPLAPSLDAYRSRLQIEREERPVARRAVELLQAAVSSLEADAQALEPAGARTEADNVIGSACRPTAPAALCPACSHGADVAAGRPVLVYIGRAGAGPTCARCAPSEPCGGARLYVSRSTDAPAAGAWAGLIPIDDDAPAVGLALGAGGLPLPSAIVDVVTDADGNVSEIRHHRAINVGGENVESARATDEALIRSTGLAPAPER